MKVMATTAKRHFTQAYWPRTKPGAGVTQMFGVSGYKGEPCVTRVRHRTVLEVRPY